MLTATAGMGFLLAVLWFDPMFDVQAWPYRRRPDEMPDETVASISRYYRRVTTDAHPMSRLVMLTMLVTLGSLVVVLVRDGFRGDQAARIAQPGDAGSRCCGGGDIRAQRGPITDRAVARVHPPCRCHTQPLQMDP